MRKIKYFLIVTFCMMIAAGCAAQEEVEESNIHIEEIAESEDTTEEAAEATAEVTVETTAEVTVEATAEVTAEGTEAAAEEVTSDVSEEVTKAPEAEELRNGYLVVIDAGHQQKGNFEKEPIGPGASETKNKVAGGTSGVSTGLKEYELNLQVALKLEKVLLERGYEVLMVRTTHEVDISNAERAEIANDAGADVLIRIHANGSENSGVHGVMTICQTPSNPYNAQCYEESRELSDCVLDCFVEATGAKKQHVWETDTMSGINWAAVPATIVEMGYMTNPEEDRKMATEDYQNLMAEGIANGIDKYFE